MAFMNMANSIIGAGIIGQPYALKQAGMVTGIVLLVVLTITVDWTIRLIVVNSKMSGAEFLPSYNAALLWKKRVDCYIHCTMGICIRWHDCVLYHSG